MSTPDIRSIVLAEQATAVCETTVSVAEIAPWLGQTYGAVAALLAAQGSAPAGPPFARYARLAEDRFEVQAGFPVPAPVVAEGPVRSTRLPAGPAAVATHIGPYEAMEPTYAALAAWIDEHGYEAAGDPWEVYLTDPEHQPDPATWVTEVVQPYRED